MATKITTRADGSLSIRYRIDRRIWGKKYHHESGRFSLFLPNHYERGSREVTIGDVVLTIGEDGRLHGEVPESWLIDLQVWEEIEDGQ